MQVNFRVCIIDGQNLIDSDDHETDAEFLIDSNLSEIEPEIDEFIENDMNIEKRYLSYI